MTEKFAYILPIDLYASLLDRGMAEDEAGDLILDWAGWRGLHATGIFYRVVNLTGANKSEVSKEPCRERKDVPRRFWHFLARAFESPNARPSIMWSHSAFSYTLIIPEGEPGFTLRPGEYQDSWESVMFDRPAAEALLASYDQRAPPPNKPGPKPGVGRYPDDPRLVEIGRALVASGYTAARAAREVASEAEGPSLDAKVDRLRKAIARG